MKFLKDFVIFLKKLREKYPLVLLNLFYLPILIRWNFIPNFFIGWENVSVESVSKEKTRSFSENSFVEERSRLNLNGSRQLSKSATELRNNDSGSPSRRGEQVESGVVHHHRHHRHATSVAQRTHIFFATLKSRWGRNRSKERKKSKDGGSVLPHGGIESDYAADYSSEHSKSSSATQSPARHCLNHPGKYFSYSFSRKE